MDDKLEQILNQGIRTYEASVEPLAGLEGRIVSRVAAAKRPSQKVSRLPWAIFASAFALGAVFWLVAQPQETRQPPMEPPKIAGRIAQPEARLAPAASRLAAIRTIRKRSHWQPPSPKLRVFPTPLPLTAGEQSLLAFARQNPQAFAQAVNGFEKQSKPLEIESLAIPPLNTNEEQ